MAMIEKLFVQIFERKKWIIDQAKHQTDLFDQHLASKLLIDGISPPVWLWNSHLHSQVSGAKDLMTKDLSSENVLQFPQPHIPFSSSHCSLDYRNAGVKIAEFHALNEGLGEGGRPSALPEYPISDLGVSSNGVPDVDFSPVSLRDGRDAISDSYRDPAMSLARLQRSKSRQRALEVRNSAKSARGRLWGEDKDGEIAGAAIASLLSDHVDELELMKPSDIDNESAEVEVAKLSNGSSKQKGDIKDAGRIARTGSSGKRNRILNVDSCYHIFGTDDKTNVESVVKSVDRNNGCCGASEAKTIEDKRCEKVQKTFSGRITRSKSCIKRQNSVEELFEQDGFSNIDNVEGFNKFMCQSTEDSKLSELVNSSEFSDESCEGIVDVGNSQITEGGTSGHLHRITQADIIKLPELENSLNIAGDDGGRLSHHAGNPSSQPSSLTGEDLDYHNEPVSQVPVMSSPRHKKIELNNRRGSEYSSAKQPLEGCISKNKGSLATGRERISQADVSNMSGQVVTNSRFSDFNKSSNLQNSRIDAGGSLQKDLDIFGVHLKVNLESEIAAFKHPGKKSGVETFCASEGGLEPVESFSASGCGVTRYRSTAFNESPPLKLLNRPEAIGLQEVSGNQVTLLPFADIGNAVDADRCAVTAEIETGTHGPNEAQYVSSSFSLDGPSPSLGPDVFISRPPSDCTVSAKPKKLEYANAESYDLSEIPSSLRREACNNLEEVPILLDSVNLSNDINSKSDKSKCNSRFNLPLLEIGEVLATEATSEAHVNNILESKFSVEGNSMLSVDISHKLHEDAAASSVLESVGKINSGILQHGDPLGKCANSLKKVFSPTSVEHVIANKSMTSRDFSFDIEVSEPQHKRLKIDGRPKNAVSTSPVLREYARQSTERDFLDGNLMNKGDNLRAIQECQQFSEADVPKSHVRHSPVKGMDKNYGHNLIEWSDSSPKVQVLKVQPSFQVQDRVRQTPFASRDGELKVLPVASLITDATGHPHCLLEKGVTDPTSTVLDVGRQCILQANQNSSHKKEKSGLVDVEHQSCERNLQEKRYLPEPSQQSSNVIGVGEAMPVFEGFLMVSEDEETCITEKGISFDKLDLSGSTIERATLLEQLCKSACINTPLSHSSSVYKLHDVMNYYRPVDSGLLDGVDLRSSIVINDTNQQLKEIDCLSESPTHSANGRSYSDHLSNSNCQSTSDVKKPYISPIGKLWDRITLNSSTSEKRRNLSLELPCITEENENADGVTDRFTEGIGLEVMTNSVERVPLADITDKSFPLLSVSESDTYIDGRSIESLDAEFSIVKAQKRINEKHGNQTSSRYASNAKENQSFSLEANGVKRITASLRNRFSRPKLSGKTSLENDGPKFLEKETKPSNIVSNIASFIPLVQQKQAATVLKGKRDIKVKALEAAEAAKRLAEKKENERRMKKEALKLERARMEQENTRQLEKKKKEDELKKKEADIAAKKRQREEKERKGKERKRLRTEGARRQLVEHDQELCAEKDEKEPICQSKDQKAQQKGGCKYDEEKIKKEREGDKLEKKPENEYLITGASIDIRENTVLENCDPVGAYDHQGKVLTYLDNAMGNMVVEKSHKKSYEISPYKGSDDEEDDNDDDDDIPNSKFIPSWASKNCLAQVIASQQKVNPEVIFPPGSFCNIAEVLLPRKHQLK